MKQENKKRTKKHFQSHKTKGSIFQFSGGFDLLYQFKVKGEGSKSWS